MSIDILNAGLELMLVGMGIVFLFLALLVVAVNVMSRVIQQYQPEDDVKVTATASSANDAAVIAAIGAAIKRYRSVHR